MRLTNTQIYEIKNKLEIFFNISNILLYNNGTFEIKNLNEFDKESLMRKAKDLKLIKYINATKKRYNFSNFKFDQGYPKPVDLYIITGYIDEKELLDNNLTEDIKINSTLNPKLWNDKNELYKDVEKKIRDIVNLFIKQLEDDNIKLIVDDIYLLGSNANYNYTDSSDLDIHIIADEAFDCTDNHLDIIYNAYKTIFNSKYDIKIKGINVEIYVENKSYITNIASGIYSLNRGWIKKPSVYQIPKIDNIKLEKKISEYEKEYFNITKNPSVDDIDKFLDNLYVKRKESLKKDGEFGIDNLVFKEIRNLGYLDNLKELKNKLIGKELSLENLNK